MRKSLNIIDNSILDIMEKYKADFIKETLEWDVLRARKKDNTLFVLKSKRESPWFFNAGSFGNGSSLVRIGNAYANALVESKADFDILYGIPEKGSRLVVATAMELYRLTYGKDVPCFHTRKVEKSHGEATDADKIKKMVVGIPPEDGMKIVTIDDVFTAGTTKYEARELLESLGNFEYPLLVIAVDRQEVGEDGKTSAIETYEQKTGTKVQSIINAVDVYKYLRSNVPIETPQGIVLEEHVRRLYRYIQKYGTEEANEAIEVLG